MSNPYFPSISSAEESPADMSAATQQIPAIPPRPSRSAGKESPNNTSLPRVPPRPLSKRIERSRSPTSERFAQSPLHEGFGKTASRSQLLSPGYDGEDPIDRAGSVPMPGVGEEGKEYDTVADELQHDDKSGMRAASPEQTRTVAEDLQIHAPKPSLPPRSAKQRVAAVTRTDSDKAASYGIGRPSHGEEGITSPQVIRKRPSTSLSTTSDTPQTDDEHGIPEIGQRVPMNPHLGDVQAPSPAPGSEEARPRNHHRKHSSRSLPPGSYGLHGHGVQSQDKLDKLDSAYYQKHPELKEKEGQGYGTHDHRQESYAMSSEDLNRLVRDTASRGAGFGTSSDTEGGPTDEVAFKASEEYTTRMSRPASAAAGRADQYEPSPLNRVTSNNDDGPIHVDEARHPEHRSYGDGDAVSDDENNDYTAPILASDTQDPKQHRHHRPAVRPHPDRSDSSDNIPSRPSSRPGSVQFNAQGPEIRYTPLEDVEEYEPLFDAEEAKKEAEKKAEKEARADENKLRRHFPSKDIWEDAPSSVHYTTEVSTPDNEHEHRRKRSSLHEDRPMTPAQLFAQRQEELAEKESHGRTGSTFLPLSADRSADKPNWAAHQAHLTTTKSVSKPRFPSRDVWEDTPESQLQQTTITPKYEEEEAKPEIPARPAKKASESLERPAVPSRPKPRQTSGDDVKPKPPLSDKPKPQIPARPSKSPSGESAREGEAKVKPPVPSRPTGGKIAALQAGFMSDLNKRLQLGPQGPKKEESPERETEEKEKAPLVDARKGRARGPQRRAPAKSPAPATEAQSTVPTLTLSLPQSVFSIDPDVGQVAVDGEQETTQSPVKVEEAVEPPSEPVPEPAVEPAADLEPEIVHSPETVQPDEFQPLEIKPEEIEPQQIEPETKSEEIKPQEPAVPEPVQPFEGKEVEPQEPPKVEQKTLVANMAGESILEANVEKREGGDVIEPKGVEDSVKT